MPTTKTKPDAITDAILSINDDAEVVTATARLTRSVQQHTAALAMTRRYEAILSPPDDVDIDPLDRLDAEANYDASRLAVVKLEAERLSAERAVITARDAARQRVADSYRSRESAAVAKLRTLLLAASEANDVLRAVQFAKHEATGLPFESLAWFELTTDPNSRLGQWDAKTKEYGFLD